MTNFGRYAYEAYVRTYRRSHAIAAWESLTALEREAWSDAAFSAIQAYQRERAESVTEERIGRATDFLGRVEQEVTKEELRRRATVLTGEFRPNPGPDPTGTVPKDVIESLHNLVVGIEARLGTLEPRVESFGDQAAYAVTLWSRETDAIAELRRRMDAFGMQLAEIGDFMRGQIAISNELQEKLRRLTVQTLGPTAASAQGEPISESEARVQ